MRRPELWWQAAACVRSMRCAGSLPSRSSFAIFRTLPCARDIGQASFFSRLISGSAESTLFLVISGFCIHLAVAKHAARDGRPVQSCHWGDFWRRRTFRLYPPYVAAIAFTLLLLFCWRWDADLCLRYRGDPLFFAKDLATHVLMTHNLFPELWNGLWNSPFWSLGLEEQLYALYAVFLFLRTRLALSKALLAPLVVAILWHGGTTVAALRGTTSFGTWAFWPFGFWMIWLLGAVAAEAYTGVIRLPAWCYSRRLA